MFHLTVLELGCSTVETEKQTHTIWKQMYMSANNINVIISGTTAIVWVWFVGTRATNNTFHWLNWMPLVNWYDLKISPRSSEIEQQFPWNVIWIDVLCSWHILIDCSLSGTFKWRNKDSLYHGTAFSNQVFFTARLIPGEILGIFLWNKRLYYQYSLSQHMTFSDFQQ